MVISSSNRSPSPMSARTNPNPNPNPNSRTQQEREGVVVAARKSFNGYPLGNGKPSIISQPRSFFPNTPANSPAEFAKRASFGRDHEQKENERDLANLKPTARPRSPSVSKGSKNFMSPTISAASKINPSPRKKVLGERNDAIRTSASLSDGKFQFFSTMSSLDFSHENEPKGESENQATDFNQVPEKIVTEFSPGERMIESEPDLVVLSPEVPVKTDVDINVGLDVMNTCCSSPSVIAPLDADPSFPPYDPKTNFLSPRPQFLCYKPNPRIESYINQGLSLEDQFASETSSEVESSEETQSQNSSKEQEDSSSSCSEEEQPPSFESNPTETHKIEEATETKTETKAEPNPRFFTKWKTLAVVLVFLLGFGAISMTYYNPSFGNVVFQDEVIAKMYKDLHVVVDIAKENFNGALQRAKLWSAHSVSHLSQLVHNWREVKTFSPVLFSNLTGWQEDEDYLVGQFELGSFFEINEDVDYVLEDFELSYVVEEEGEETKIDTTTENFAELQCNPKTEEQELSVEETNPADMDDFKPGKVEENSAVIPFLGHENSLIEVEVSEIEMQSNPETEEPEEVDGNSVVLPLDRDGISMIEEETDTSADLQGEFPGEDNSEGSMSQGPEIPPQIVTSSEPLAEDDQSSSINFETEEMIDEVKTNSEMVLEATPRNSELLGSSSEISLTPSMTAVSLVALSLLTVAAAFMYMKPKKNTSVLSAPLTADQLAAKEKSMIEKSVASVKEPSINESPPSCSGQVEVDNMMSEPCPSEMSSFQKTSSHSKRGGRKGIDEAQSQSLERRPQRDYNKRESLASSSSEYTMCSSFGSFTTYSIIPSKKGDEEVVTPVRRSSRIRSKVTSP